MTGMEFPVVILAGGLATRMYPLTQSIPKALLDVNGEPFIAHQLRLLQQSGIRDIIVCLGHHGDQVVERIGGGSQFGLRVQYSFDGPRLLGTAGAIRQAFHLLPPRFFVLYGDSYLQVDYTAVQAAFASSGKPALMTVYHNLGNYDTSNVEYNQGRILAYNKTDRTPGMEYIDYGLGMFSRDVFLTIPQDTPFDLASLYQDLLRKNQLAGYEVSQRFYEIGSFAGLEELRSYLRGKTRGGQDFTKA